MTHRAVLELLQQVVRLEGSTDDQRLPRLLAPRSLFPEPVFYVEALRHLSRSGAVTLDDVPWRALWTQWFSASPWHLARIWQPLGGSSPAISAVRHQPALARRLYRRVQLSDALGVLAHELSAHGFDPRWAAEVTPIMRAMGLSRSTGILAATAEWAVRQVASAYLKGASPFELQDLLKVSVVQHSVLDLPKAAAPSPVSAVTGWMSESLRAVGVDYWISAPSAILGPEGRRPRENAAGRRRKGWPEAATSALRDLIAPA